MEEEYYHILKENERLTDTIKALLGVIKDVYPEILEKVKEAQEKESMQHIENHSIEELELSVRSYNCLKRAGLHTIGDVIDYDIDDHKKWANLRNLGRKSLVEITERMLAVANYKMVSVF